MHEKMALQRLSLDDKEEEQQQNADDHALQQAVEQINDLVNANANDDDQHSTTSGAASRCIPCLISILVDVLPQYFVNDKSISSHTVWTEKLIGSEARQPRWCTYIALSEALSSSSSPSPSSISRRDDQHDPRYRSQQKTVAKVRVEWPDQTTVDLIVKHLEDDYVIGHGFADIIEEICSTRIEKSMIDRILQGVALIPLRVANLKQGSTPMYLKASAIFDSFTRQCLDYIGSSRSGQENSLSYQTLWGAFVHKACKMGQADVVMGVWADCLLGDSSSSSSIGHSRKDFHASLFQALPLPAFEPTLLSLLRAIFSQGDTISYQEAQDALKLALSLALTSKSDSPALRAILINKLLLSQGSLSGSIAVLIVRLLMETDRKGLPALIGSLTMVWKEREFIRAVNAFQQDYITHALVAALAGIKHKEEIEQRDGLIGSLLEGVSAHLESALEPVRLDGMRVAEAFARIMDQPLKFEELDGKRYIIAPGDVFTIKQSSRKRSRHITTITMNGDRKALDTPTSDNTSAKSDQGEEDNDVDKDEEEMLEPLDMSDDESDIAPLAPPRYLSRILEYLRVRDEDDAFDRQQATLQSLEKVVRSRPADLSDLSCIIARELLTLDNRFNMEGFEMMRHAGLIALIATDPERVAPMFCQLAFDTNLAFGTRFEVLDLLLAGAKDLAMLGESKSESSVIIKNQEKSSEGPRIQGKRSLVPTTTATNKDLRSGTDDKTRRWGYRRKETPRTIRNLFDPVAAQCFFHPLIHELVRRCSKSSLDADGDGAMRRELEPPDLAEEEGRLGGENVWARDNDKALALAKTTQTLTGFVECSGHSPGTASLAQELLAFAWPLRLSSFPELRRAVLLALACALSHTRINQLMSASTNEIWSSLTAWMESTRECDPDQECRRIARLLTSTNTTITTKSL